MRFDSTALDANLIRALADKGFHTAFPIQELTLEMGIRGQDIIGQARTGTGKTLGFGLPLLHRIDPDKNFVQALIVAPTRELTAQVAEDLQIGSARGLNVTAVYGGVPIDPQFDALKTAHVVVGTPGRLLDHLNRGTMDLSRVSELVLDEADEMLDMGFLPDVERLMAACPSSDERHTALFSATMAPAIVSLARRYMNSPSFLHAKSDEPQTAELVEQHFFLVHRMDKPRVLARIMQQEGREGCYVFSRTKAMCDRLVTELEDLGVKAIAIHGDLRQATREKNLDKFRSGEVSILVATEVAARGLDVDNVTHVVNYDCPDDDKMYLHRIGRTARAGREGVAITFAQFNEVERLNVIRKAVGAYDGDLKEVFSTSEDLRTIFDLPEETPWAHLSKRGSSKPRSKPSSATSGSSRDGGRPQRDDDRSTRKPRETSRDNGRNRDETREDTRPARKPRETSRDNGRDRDETREDTRPARKPRDSSRDNGRDRDEAREDTRPARKPRESSRDHSRDRDGGGDKGITRTRTRTRVQPKGDTPTARGRDEDRSSRQDRDRSRGRDDRGGRGRDDRERDDRDRGRDSDGNRARSGDDDTTQARPRARRRARGARGEGSSAAKSDDGKGRGEGRDEAPRSRERQSTRDRSSTRDRDGGRQRSERNDRNDRGGRSERGGREDEGRGDQRRDGGRGGRNSRGGSSSGSRGGSGPSDSGGRGGNNRSDRGGSASGGGQRSAARTTADRRTERGEDARGDGTPRLARRVEVENLP